MYYTVLYSSLISSFLLLQFNFLRDFIFQKSFRLIEKLCSDLMDGWK